MYTEFDAKNIKSATENGHGLIRMSSPFRAPITLCISIDRV